MTYQRGYTFACICGRQASGSYAVDEPADINAWRNLAVVPDKATCSEARGRAAGQPLSKTEVHYVGCGRTLRQSDAERASLLETVQS